MLSGSRGTAISCVLGIINGQLHITLAEGVTATLTGVRVIEHQLPLLILESDLLRGGQPGEWNFAGICQATMGAGLVEGSLEFTKGEQLLRSSRLVHCPTAGAAKFTSSVFGQGLGLVAHMLGSATAAPKYV